MSAYAPVKLRLTTTEAKMLLEVLDMVNVVVPYLWYSDRAVKTHRAAQVADRIVTALSRLEVDGVGGVPAAAPGVPDGT
jgi:hypothetical protein